MPTQLRFAFARPQRSAHLELSLDGLTVTASLVSGTHTDAQLLLAEAGVDVRIQPDGTIAFPVSQIGLLDRLDSRCRIHPRGAVTCLVELARARGMGTASVSTNQSGRLRIQFWQNGALVDRPLDPSTARALCCTDLPFVASAAAWEQLEAIAAVPHTIARASSGPDGFVELVAARPQLVESLPTPGLFRLSPTRFGVAAPHARHLTQVRGILWDTPPPQPATPDPGVMEALPVPLAPATRRMCARLVDRIASWNAAILVAEGGRARRTITTSALEVLDAWPALVVCPPWALWAWWRTVTLVGRTLGVNRQDRADVRVVTWMDLAHGAPIDPAAVVVLDDLCGPDAARAAVAGAAARLDAVAGWTRIGVTDRWPDDPEMAIAAANWVRPVEFDLGDQPLTWRYPLRPLQRVTEHLDAWIVGSNADRSDLNNTAFRHSQVRLAPLSHTQQELLAAVRTSSHPSRLFESIGVVEAGGPGATGSKLALCLEEIDLALNNGLGPVAVWVCGARTAVLLRRLGGARQMVVCTPDDAATVLAGADRSTVVVVCGNRPGDLTAADVVIVATLAVSAQELDLAVGSAHLDVGPRRVVVLHSPASPDDRLATWSIGGGGLGDTVDDARVDWLLSPRWGAAN